MSKKLLALLLAMIMVIGSFTSVLADTTPKADEKKAEEVKTDKKDEAKPEEKKEEKKEEPAKDEALERAMDVLKKAAVIEGFKAGEEDFKAEKNVTRAEFAAMIVRANNLAKAAEAAKATPTGFTDVPVTHWANGYIAIARNQMYVNGYPSGKFMPEGQITYQEMAKMLVCALGKGEVGDIWPTSYIVKAQSLGLLNGVTVPVFTEKATRGDVFKMLYNMMTSKEFGKRKILKAIVLENNRVENLADNEVTVEVIDIVQKADWADRSRDKKGDQHKYVLDKDLKLDVEQLLGKVVDLTVDQNDKIVEVKEDKTYDYVEGKVTNVTRSKLGINRVNYSVGFDERYDETDERIFRTYLNDRNYTYRDFAEKYVKGKYDFARVTMKNGKVIFIDAYQFDDIAPVTNVKDGDVYYRDDARDANEFKAAALDSRVIFKDKSGYSIANKKDIVKDDVIHFYNDYESAIVRKDSKVETELVKTHRDSNREYVVGKDAEYPLNPNKPFRAIYSMEGKYFNVVEDRSSLEPVIKDNVKILLALDNTVQLVESAKAWKDGINAVKKVYSKGEVELLPAKGEKFWAVETRATKYENYLVDGNTNNRRLLDFEYDDIVYYTGNDKNEINKMGVLVKKYTDAGTKGYKERLQVTSLTPRYITSGTKDYRYFSGLNAFYLDKKNNLQQINDWDTFYKYNKDNKDLQSYVVSELALKKALGENNVKTYNFLSDADDIASLVIFDKVVETKYDTIVAEVKDLYYSTDEARFVDAKGNEYLVELDKYPKKFENDDIVELQLDKVSRAKKEKTVVGHVSDVLIRAKDETVVIKAQRPTNEFKVIYNNGMEETVYFDGDTVEFGRQSTDYAQIKTVKDDKTGKTFVSAIRYMRDPIGSSTKPYATLADLNAADYGTIKINGQSYDVTPNMLFIDGANKEFGLKGVALIIKYVGGKVEVTKTRDGRIVAVEGKATSDKVLAESVRDAIERFGKFETTQATGTAPTAAEMKVLEDKIKDYLKEKNLDKIVGTATSYVAATTSPAVAEHFNTVVTVGSVTANAMNFIDRVTAPTAPTADEVYTAIEDLRDKVTPVPAINKDGTLDNAVILNSVASKLQLALDDETLANKYPKLAKIDLTKLAIDGTPTVKAGTTNVYEVQFKYDGINMTKKVEIELAKKPEK